MSTPESRRAEFNGAIAAAIGSTSVGFVPFFIIGLQQAGVGTVSSLVWRYAVALAVLLPLALWRHRLVEEWRRGGKWLVLNGLTLGVFQVYCYFSAIERLPTSVVVTIFYCYPVLALVLDRLLFAIPFGPATFASVLVIVLGVALTSLPGLLGATLDPVGVMMVLMSALGYSFYIAAAYPVTKAVAPLASAVFIYGAYGVAFGAVAMVVGFNAPLRPDLWLNVLFIGTLGGALQILSFAFALPRLSSSGYAAIVSLEFVTVVLAGVVLLGESLVGVQWVGIGLVLAGIVLVRLMRAAEAARRTAAATVAAERA